jgi:hypothetical protein
VRRTDRGTDDASASALNGQSSSKAFFEVLHMRGRQRAFKFQALEIDTHWARCSGVSWVAALTAETDSAHSLWSSGTWRGRARTGSFLASANSADRVGR